MVDLDDGAIKASPLRSWEVGEFHLPAHINADRYIKQMEGELFEIFVFLGVLTDFV